MTDHIRDSIDQNFPPEPPDDPAPEPVPPPDDLAPCPVCDASGHAVGLLAYCDNCELIVSVVMWRRLARAVALLRAVERIEKRERRASVGRLARAIKLTWFSDGTIYLEGQLTHHAKGPTLADALIALAAQLEALDG